MRRVRTVGPSLLAALLVGLDQGLAFVSFQRRMSQFLNTQARLAGEPPEEYIEPQGGGFSFALPGPTAGRWLGQDLFA